MNKTISIISTFILFFSFLSVGQSCQAQEESISFSATGGKVVPGFINATNTGFEVGGIIADREDFAYAKVRTEPAGLDLSSNNLDRGSFLVLQSDMFLDDLRAKFPEGPNTISLSVYDTSDSLLNKVEVEVIADYTLGNPQLDIKHNVFSNTSDGFLKIGDSAEFTLSSDERLVVPDSKLSGRELTWVEGLTEGVYTYKSRFEVQKGDKDVALPYEFDILYQDLSGNAGKARFDLERRIDANLPDIDILSIKEGEIFKDSDIEVCFNPSETLGSYKIYLNGVLRDTNNGEKIKGLADGDYALKIIGTDLAGNKAEKTVNFTIDTKVPEVSITNELRNTYNQGDEIVLEGKTDPGSRVIVEIHSDIRYFETVADVDGNWRLTIDTSDLEEDWHDIYLKIIDPAGNISRVLLGSFEIIVPVVEEAQAREEEPIKFARAETIAVVTDASSAMVTYDKAPLKEEEVAIEPRIISSSDERNIGINWSAWLILIGLVAVSFLVAFVSYYGYSQAAAVVGKQKIRTGSFVLPPKPQPEEPKEEEREVKKEAETSENTKIADSADKDDEETDAQVRW